MQRGDTLKVGRVDEIGTTLALSLTAGRYLYRGLLTRHTCTAPRRVDVGDPMVIKSASPNKHVLVQIPCGCELMLFVA